MAKKITLAMLLEAKRVHGISWTWFPYDRLPAQRARFSGGRNLTEYQLSCGGCGEMKWVLWSQIKAGRTKACRTCAKKPSLETMRKVALTNDAYWVPLGPTKQVGGRLSILVRCKCGKEKYISWNRLQQGLARGCASCSSYLRTHGLGDDPIRISWLRLMHKKANRVTKAWHTFENFQKWAKDLYAPGWKLVRRDKKKHYGPDNCDYVIRDYDKFVALQPTASKTPEQKPEIELPIGNVTAIPKAFSDDGSPL